MALLDAEIAKNRADEEEQAKAQEEEYARLRLRALEGDAEAQATLDYIHDVESRRARRG
jgi:hypothetical protein